MFNNPNYSLADIAAVNGRNEDGLMGGGLFYCSCSLLEAVASAGGGANQGALTRADLTYGFDMNNLERQVGDINTAICSGFNLTNSNLANGFAGAQNAFLLDHSQFLPIRSRILIHYLILMLMAILAPLLLPLLIPQTISQQAAAAHNRRE